MTEHTTTQIAALYGVTTATVRRWIRLDRIAGVKRGSRWVLDPAANASLDARAARNVAREAVVAYRRGCDVPMVLRPTVAQAAQFAAGVAVVAERRAFALARLRAVGMHDVAHALVEEAGAAGLPGGVHRHRVAVARRVVALALTPVGEPVATDAVAMFDAGVRPAVDAAAVRAKMLRAAARLRGESA